MSFFSAAEGVGAPALVLEGDHWKCLVRMDEDRGKEEEQKLREACMMMI